MLSENKNNLNCILNSLKDFYLGFQDLASAKERENKEMLTKLIFTCMVGYIFLISVVISYSRKFHNKAILLRSENDICTRILTASLEWLYIQN